MGDKEYQLQDAARSGDVERVRRLLAEGANANAANLFGRTALHESANAEVVKLLLSAGTLANASDKNGRTPLHGCWNADIAKALIGAGAIVNMQDKNRQTPLQSRIGDVEIVKILLSNGAQVGTLNQDGNSSLHLAVLKGHIGSLKAILSHPGSGPGLINVNITDLHKQTPLHIAVQKGSIETLPCLLAHPTVDCNLIDSEGDAPIHIACLKDSVATLTALCSHRGTDVNLRNGQGSTPLHIASLKGQMHLLKVLLTRSDLNADARDGLDHTPLHMATQGGHVEFLRELLSHHPGIDVNAIGTIDGSTALHTAIQIENVECVKLLLSQPTIKVNACHRDGRAPIQVAIIAGNAAILRDLLNHPGIDINVKDEAGYTPLRMATQRGDEECMRTILDHPSVDVNLRSTEGDTSLHLATLMGEVECVRVLLSHPDIDINVRNAEGRTAMMDAECEVLAVFVETMKTCRNFPVNTYGKVVLCGGMGVGKSTLAHIIVKLSKPNSAASIKKILGRTYRVKPFTAGINCYQVNDSTSNMIVYDLAGHQRYFSSHCACLEAISLNNPATFVILLDLTKDLEKNKKELYRWTMLVDTVCQHCPHKSSVIVVGTHADLLAPEQLSEVLLALRRAVSEAVQGQDLAQLLTLNLKDMHNEDVDHFLCLLHEVNNVVVDKCPSTPMHCHLLYAFLKERLPADLVAITLSDLCSWLAREPDKIISHDPSQVGRLLEGLSDKGLVIFVSCQDAHRSWIVLHWEGLLGKVMGGLFADPLALKGSTHVSSSTGIISKMSLQKAFPEYDVDMVVQFLVKLELCCLIDIADVETNMASDQLPTSQPGSLLFMPALVSTGRPGKTPVTGHSFRWLVNVDHPAPSFSPRFLHVLVLRLLSRFPTKEACCSLSCLSLCSSCTVWSSGMMWVDGSDVTAEVEMDEHFRSLSIVLCSPNLRSPHYIHLSHSILEVVHSTREEFCSYADVTEMITCPPSASSTHMEVDVGLHSLREALDCGGWKAEECISSAHVSLEEWLKVEPSLPLLIGSQIRGITVIDDDGMSTLEANDDMGLDVKWNMANVVRSKDSESPRLDDQSVEQVSIEWKNEDHTSTSTKKSVLGGKMSVPGSSSAVLCVKFTSR